MNKNALSPKLQFDLKFLLLASMGISVLTGISTASCKDLVAALVIVGSGCIRIAGIASRQNLSALITSFGISVGVLGWLVSNDVLRRFSTTKSPFVFEDWFNTVFLLYSVPAFFLWYDLCQRSRNETMNSVFRRLVLELIIAWPLWMILASIGYINVCSY